MAELNERLDITVEELEENLGSSKLGKFIKDSEANFIARTETVISKICDNPEIKAVFISGPTSSGKTTFTMRLSSGLSKVGRKAAFLSLDDYYQLTDLTYDEDGRPDFESIETLNLERANSDIKRIINHEAVHTPIYDFKSRTSTDSAEAIELPEDGILVVEGLHGLNNRISGGIKDSECIKIFIMPYGNVYCDTKLMDKKEIRLLRRIIRDARHRNAHALTTIDYWPMIDNSETAYYEDYLTNADYHVNSFLAYESLVIAPLAYEEIKKALDAYENGTLTPSSFMEKSNTGKAFADLDKAVARAKKLMSHLDKIPVCDPKRVPDNSILLEFISDN